MIRTPDFSQAHDDIVAFVRSHANEHGYLKTVTREVDSPYAVMYTSPSSMDILEYPIFGIRVVGNCIDVCINDRPLPEDELERYMNEMPWWVSVDNNCEILYAQTLFNIAYYLKNYEKENN